MSSTYGRTESLEKIALDELLNPQNQEVVKQMEDKMNELREIAEKYLDKIVHEYEATLGVTVSYGHYQTTLHTILTNIQ